MSPWMCTRSTCAVVIDNLLVYRDDNHLSTFYPAWLAPVLSVELDELAPTGRPDTSAAPLGAGRPGDGSPAAPDGVRQVRRGRAHRRDLLGGSPG